MSDQLLDIREAAAVLKVSVSTLRRWRSKGVGPRSVLVGPRALRYRVTDLVAFLTGLESE